MSFENYKNKHMKQQKKFGAFSGVFTPSVLTILGVIMYMRLGWVVGNAGLITTFIIIIVSHIVSVSTGLSISSVATDKKIKTGGIYYILSRSLGFPMGGAIGIALFIATALGISLYLVGFAESLLAVDGIRDFLHLEQGDLNSYRIVASAALVALFVLAFISTSLAIKSQFFVMAAIFLSIISILVGIFTGSDLSSVSISISPVSRGVSMQEIFGVFFPAVTGFTAGVAMSGDLKNPKRDIPRGTLSAIAVGFVIYSGLALVFAFFVDREVLLNDYNFLLKVSLYAPLVLAGIWGATLSSALGGILGGPRILQAIAKDKIMPKIFAKGYGPSNEPRNALIFIFIIAEGGILIGSLNAIAGVVSMFYLASYSFINLAFFLENWASTDFRPSFKVKGIVGLIGFVAGFLVMAQLGLLSMIAALVIMFGIFAWLNRKQFKSESGDVWQSVWLSVVRKALYSLNKKNLEDRNWQPNIILFSGGESKRPYLLEFGKDLVGRYGLLSNFDLHETKDVKYLFPKHLQANNTNEVDVKGVFTRKQTCSDIYSGIETIISTYGFSGIEPNTVLMGWMRQSKNPLRFSEMIRRINELDVNLLLMDYDKRYGFRKYKTIDIWWRGSGNNGNLALNLVKFLKASDNWEDATFRLLVGLNKNEDAEKIRRHAELVLNNMRINAEIKIINNQINQLPFYELIRTESLDTDLIILGLPDIKEGREEEFVANTSALMHQIGTVILIKASSQFKNLNLGMEYIAADMQENVLVSKADDFNIKHQIHVPENPVLAENIKHLHATINQFDNLYNDLLSQSFIPSYEFIAKVLDESETVLNDKINRIKEGNNQDYLKTLSVGTDKLLKSVQSYVRDYKINVIPKQSELMEISYNTVKDKILAVANELPEYIFLKYALSDLQYDKNDPAELQKFKSVNRLKLKLNNKNIPYKIKYKDFVKGYIPAENLKIYNETGKLIGTLHFQFIISLQRLIKNIRSGILKIQSDLFADRSDFETIRQISADLQTEIDAIKKMKNDAVESVYTSLHQKNIGIVNEISKQLEETHPNRFVKKTKSKKEITALTEQLMSIPDFWKRNEQLFLNTWSLELLFLEFENRMYRIIGKSIDSAELLIKELILTKIALLEQSFNNYLSEFAQNSNAVYQKAELSELLSKNEISYQLKKLLVSSFEKFKYLIDRFPAKIELLTHEAYNNITEHQFDELETIEVSVSSMLDFVIQSELNRPLAEMAKVLPNNIVELEQSVHNIQSLVAFTLFDNDGKLIENKGNTDSHVRGIIEKQLESLNKLREQTHNEIIALHRRVNERLSEVSNHLHIYLLIKNAGESKNFAKKKAKETKDKKRRLFETFELKKLQFINKSKDIAILNRSKTASEKTVSKVKCTLDTVLNVSPEQAVFETLPFYYKQLFLRNENFNTDFFVNRETEIAQLEETFKRYELGYKGGVLITGEAYSGKSFLAHYYIDKYQKHRKIYTVKAPETGATELKIFEQSLNAILKPENLSIRRLSKMEQGSVLFFDALELWWENSELGYAVIDKIKELIRDYSDKIIFVVTLNTYTLKQVKKDSDFDNYFLNIIDCSPFSSGDMAKALLRRHNAGGMPFVLNDKRQERMKPAEEERLFADYVRYSGGNIGFAVFSWIAKIKSYENNQIVIKNPGQIDISALELFSDEVNELLKQFVINRRLSLKRTARILKQEEADIIDNYTFLQRSGIITEFVKDVFELNRFMYVPVKKHLKNKELI